MPRTNFKLIILTCRKNMSENNTLNFISNNLLKIKSHPYTRWLFIKSSKNYLVVWITTSDKKF